ncbi:MAG: adenosine kinase [Candidatus Aureabacteria bacterium]|nr:adenosine kinase [Candidatus Auribacterota bacterium]
MPFEILGIGSALVDVMIRVNDEFLTKEGLPKGGMTLVEADRSKDLLDQFPDSAKQFCPGGAAANVIASFACCGGNAAFAGKIGKDKTGDYFKTQTEKALVHYLELYSPDRQTGIVVSFITPDGERTFATHLGAAVEMTPDDLTPAVMNQAPLLLVEAYLVFNPDLFTHILKTARTNGQKMALDLSSFTVVEQNKDRFKKALENKYVDILFANEDESRAFTGLPPQESLNVFTSYCETAVVKEGGKGSFISKNGRTVRIPAEKVNVADTNGAGDAYAGGILFGLSKNLDIQTAGALGSKAGALIVSQSGARLTPENAAILNDYAKKILNS